MAKKTCKDCWRFWEREEIEHTVEGNYLIKKYYCGIMENFLYSHRLYSLKICPEFKEKMRKVKK